MDMRCEFKLHGIVIQPGVLEVKCDSRLCGAEYGVVVLHRFDLVTGSLIKTVRFKDTTKLGRRGLNGSC